MLAHALAIVALAYFAAAAPMPQDSLTHTIMALPSGPTTVTYTWTYPFSETRTVVYGGAGWTTYAEYTTIDGSRVVTTIVAPTRIATAAPTISQIAVDRSAGSSCGLIMAIVVPAIVMVLLGVFFWWRLTKEKRLRREAAAQTKEVKEIKEVDSGTSSEASSICEKAEQ